MIRTEDGYSIEQYPNENKIVIITPRQQMLAERDMMCLLELVKLWSKEQK